MRITRDTLLKIARDTTAQQTQINRHIICVYLTGSLLGDDPLLGGSTDIDLIFVQNTEPLHEREIIKFTDEIHLDIAHISQTKFSQPRNLRSDPWIGSYMCANPMVLFDIKHWFEFTQAGVCAQFNRPDNVLTRSRPLAEAARQSWLSLSTQKEIPACQQVRIYLKALENAANSIACLNGPPLTERRFLLNLADRAEAAGHPELADGWMDLFNCSPLTEEDWQKWIKGWREDLLKAGQLQNPPVALHPYRLVYYERAIDVLRSDHPIAALWLLIHTWSRAICSLPENSPHSKSWQTACRALELDGEKLSVRVEALDGYLDSLEDVLEDWAQQNGV